MKSLYSLGLAGLMVLFGLNWTAQAWAVDANGTYQDTQTYTDGINENLTIDDGATATETGPITGADTDNYTVTGKGTLNLRNDTNSDFTGGITFTSGNINVLKRTNLIKQMSKFIFNSANTVAKTVTDALALFKVYQTDANKATVLNTLSAIDYSLATLSLGTATEKAVISFDNQHLGTTQSLTIVNSLAGRIHLSKDSTLTLENMSYTTTTPTTTTGGIIVNRYGFLALTGDEGSLYTIQNNSSSFQSAFYNYGTLFISDVLIQNNVSTRSSTSYNLATLIFLGEATYKNNLTRNYAQVGGIYNSTGGTIYFFGPADFTGNGYLDHTPTSSSTMNPGVFYNSNQGTIDFFDVAQFVENQGFQGGAIYSLTNSNSAQTYAIFFHGKATFDKNKAGNDNRAGSGGGIYLLGGTIKFDDGVVFNENKAFDGTSTNNKSGFGGGIFLDWASGRATSIVEISGDFEFTKNVAGVSGGAMHLGNNSRLDIKLTGGKEGLFSGNVAADQANSLHFELTTNRTSTFALTIADNAYLRMHDPMTGIIGANSTLTIEMTGQGRWDLGGQSTFGSEGSTIISINGGTLYLYRQGETKDVSDNVVAAGKINLAATTTPTSSAFTLASGATLGIGGGNAIVTENGRIYIDVGSTLAFNLNGYDTTASVPMLLLDGDVFITDTGTTGGKIGLDLSSLPDEDAEYILVRQDNNAGTMLTADNVNTAVTYRGDDIPDDVEVIITITDALISAAVSFKAALVSAYLAWSGATDGNWDTVTKNWMKGAAEAAFSVGDIVNFDEEGTRTDINLGGVAVSAAGVYVKGSKDYVFGNGSLTIDSSLGEWEDGVQAASGKLTLGAYASSGGITSSLFTGALDLTATSGNDFEKGIDLYSGRLIVSDVSQLGADLKLVSFLADRPASLTTHIANLTQAIKGGTGVPGKLATYASAVDGAISGGTLPAIVLKADSMTAFDGESSHGDQRLILADDKSGALHLGGQASLTFKDGRADAGGAVKTGEGSLLALTAEGPLAKFHFTGNQATGNGGAINGAGLVSLTQAEFIRNEAIFGGAIYSDSGQIVLIGHNKFEGNSAQKGGAIYVEGANGLLNVSDGDYIKNVASESGGAIYLGPRAIAALSLADNLTSTFSGNTANGAANSISLNDGSSLYANVDQYAILDMHDPLGGNNSLTDEIEIEKDGQGLWKLGGDSLFTVTTPASHSIGFSVTAGQLYLYGEDGKTKDANEASVAKGTITLEGDGSSFTLAGGATLGSGGGNSIIVEGGSITLASGSTLVFDIANFTPVGDDGNGGTTGLTLKAANLDWSSGTSLNPDIDLSSFIEGTFDLITAVGLLSSIDVPTTVTINGQSLNTRASLTLSKKSGAENDTLQLTASMAGDNLNLTWNGPGNDWTVGGQEPWKDVSANATYFMPGDAVTFATDTSLAVGDTGVKVAGMVIDGGTHSFSGGAISSTDDIKGSDVIASEKLEVRNSAEATFANDIDFENGLEIQSAAKVTLAGEGSFADGMDIANAGELVFDTADDYDQNGLISGAGALTKKGAYNLTLTAQNTYTGLTTVNEGLLTVAETGAVAGNVNVTSGGLDVRGSVGGSVNIAASQNAYLFAGAGGSIGGNLTMGDSSVLQIASENEALVVGGVTSLGAITAQLYGFDWKRQDYEVLEVADESELDSFEDQSLDYALVDYTLTRSGNRLMLAVTGSSSPVSKAVTGNQKAVAGVFRSLRVGGALRTFIESALPSMSDSEYLDALDQLSAPVVPQVLEIAGGLSHNFAKNVISHLAEKHWLNFNPSQDYASSANAPAAGAGDFSGVGHNLWFSAGGFYARYDGEDNLSDTIVTGYDIRLGYDLSLESGWLAGAVLGFDNQRIGMDRPYGRVDVDSFSAAIYGGRQFQAGPGILRLLLGASFSSHSVDSERVVNIAGVRDSLKADYHGQTWQIFGEVAWNFNLGPNTSLEPYLNLTWQKTTLNSFNETGRLFALTTKKSSTDNFRTNLGLRAKAKITDKVSVSGALGWEHTFGSVRPETTVAFRDSGSYFKAQGSPISRDSVTAEVSLNVDITESVSFKASYDGAFGKKSQRHAGTAMLSFSWK